MKRTKILATIGPASAKPEIVRAMIEAGVNAFRINLSHGDQKQWEEFIGIIRAITRDHPIILDTAGPEVRLLNVPTEIHLTTGQEFVFSIHSRAHIAHTSHPITIREGTNVLLDDGAITLHVDRVADGYVHCTVRNEGTLIDRRKVTVPSGVIDLPILTTRDEHALHTCLTHGADAVALSFTQRPEDIETCRAVVGHRVMIIAKIENRAGVEQAEHIIHAADAIMIARGDLGVEIPLEEVPRVQKQLAHATALIGKPVIVATQMLESMTSSPRPTRAEVSDVANAILDGADTVMLSGETARGQYPVHAVQMMARIAEATDTYAKTPFLRSEQGRISTAEAVSIGVYDMATALHANAIVTATASGFTARMVARFRPQVPVIAVAHEEHVKRLLQLTWGVVPCMFTKENLHAHETIPDAVRSALEQGLLKETDLVIATAGVNTRRAGSTNLIEIHHARDLLTFHAEAHHTH